jgi:hypothetical protein
MARALLKTVAIFLFFVLLSSEVYAINLGSIAKNSFAKITNYESVVFKMLFWNAEEETYKLKLSVKELPEDWIVIIDNDEFELNSSTGEEYIKLPYMDDNIRAKVVNLFVKPSPDSKSGNYSIVVSAGIEADNETGGIIIVPETLMKFEIDLTGTADPEDTGNIGATEKNNITGKQVTGLSTPNNIYENRIYLYVIILFAVIFISFVLYKKS